MHAYIRVMYYSYHDLALIRLYVDRSPTIKAKVHIELCNSLVILLLIPKDCITYATGGLKMSQETSVRTRIALLEGKGYR